MPHVLINNQPPVNKPADTKPPATPAGTDPKPPASSAGKPGPAGKGFKYRCTEPCTYLKMYRKAGEIIILPEKKEVPHFKLVE
jgi:hypothetical protein